MRTIRHVGDFVKDKYKIFEKLDELQVNYDVVPVANLSFRDGIMYRPPQYTYGLEKDTDEWLSMPSVMIPERMMWCDCHKHDKFQKQVIKNYKDLTKSELNSIWGGRAPVNVTDELIKNFPHTRAKTYDNVTTEVCENRSLDYTNENRTKYERPTKWHLKAVFYDYDGGAYEHWFYPDDLIIRVQYSSDIHSSCHLTTISDWTSYGHMDGGGYTRADFERELGENWTWDIDNPRKCFHDNCIDYKDYEDYKPIFTNIKETVYKNTLENLILQQKFARYYRVIKHNNDEDLDILQDNQFTNMFGLDTERNANIYTELAFKSVVEMCYQIGIINSMNKIITDEDVLSLVEWFNHKINDIKHAIEHEKPVSYLIENILERQIENKNLEELYI